MRRKNYTEDELILLAKRFSNGDPDAFSEIYDYFADNIYRFIYFKVRGADSEDLTEIVFIKAWENHKKYDPTKSSLSSWLYTIARNTVIDHYRVHKTTEELTIDLKDNDQAKNPKYMAEIAVNAEKVREAIGRLSRNYQEIVLLRFIEDLDYAEIAKILDKTEGSIRIMQFRAIKELKDELRKMGFDE